MATVRSHAVRCAVLVAALVVSGIGCRGEHEEAAPPPADEKLAWPALDEATLTAWGTTGGFARGAPEPLAIAPDGAVLFARARPRDPSADLYQLDAAGKTSVLAAAATLLAGAPVPDAERAAASRGITAIELSTDGARVLIPLAGRLFVIDRATGAARELEVGAHRDPRLSPDGKLVAFVRDGDLWVAAIPPASAAGTPPAAAPPAPAAGGPAPPRVVIAATRLTQHPPDREYATPEAVARDFGRDRAYWWSPDSQSIAFQRTDARAVETVFLGDPRHLELAPRAIKFPRSGKANASVDLGIVSARGGAPRWVTWDLARYPYLVQASWPARAPLTLIVVGRDQTQAAVLAVDPAGATRALHVDKDPAWINVAPDALTWLPDGSGFLWMTESHGAWSLEHHAADGALVREVVTADVGLRRVAGVSPDGHELIIEAANDPREQQVWRVPLAGGAPVALTPVAAGGVHRAWSGHGAVVIASANRAGGGATAVIRGDGPHVEVPSVAEHPRAPTTKLETVQLEDHIQDVAITRPRSLAPGVRYPVLLRVEADPDVKAVRDALDGYALDQWYADAGFIVVRSDGRGTPGRDRTWQHAIAGDAVTRPMNDQIGALKLLGARNPELDLDRVGVLGAGGDGRGGHLAVLSVLLHPDVFAAAVAVSPITDWELLSTAFSERTMNNPAANAEGYRRSNAAAYAEQLSRPLLILHRVTDDRVHFAHVLALLEALYAAGKHVEVGTLPATSDPTLEIAGQKLVVDFLRGHLGPPVRPAVMPAPRSEEEEEERERERERGGVKDRKDHGDKDRGDKDRGDKDRGDKDRGDKDRGDKDRGDKDRR
jgi:dipeptidyl-peptidase-4